MEFIAFSWRRNTLNKSEALILGLKLYMYNVHAYMHIMQCTICNFGFYSLGRISSADLHIFAFLSDEMHVIAIFDQKRVKLHFLGDIKYIADSSLCLPFPLLIAKLNVQYPLSE